MPQIGEVKRGWEIGRGSKDWRMGSYGQDWYAWRACIDCGRQRWVLLRRGKPENKRCLPCSNKQKGRTHRKEKHYNWKGGRHHTVGGYIEFKLYANDFFYPMAQKNGYVLEHRLVMAIHLGRCLKCGEVVHHKNHIRDDNRIENLQLISDNRHKQISILEAKIDRLLKTQSQLQQRVTLLEAENVALTYNITNKEVLTIKKCHELYAKIKRDKEW